MGLLPIEFTDCLTDSPYFRENLHAHERELDTTSIQIKGLIREVKQLLNAAKALSNVQRNLADHLSKFEFQCIGGSQTDDEIIIAGALKEFGRLLSAIEDERERMLQRAMSSFIEPIESFRREQIGSAKEEKKKFDKETAKFCQSLERHLNLSTRKSEAHLQEADASLVMEQRHFYQASLEYVHKLQEVQERKKFEFVETILTFMYGWLTFYHQGHEVAKEFKCFMTDLQIRLQRTRDNYNATCDETENLMKKMLEIRKTKPQDPGILNKMYSRQGYLYLMEKKAFGTTWIKTFCQYQKENRRFTMIPYSQTVGKITTTETIQLKECIRRMSDSIDKRFCFDIVAADKQATFTFQALSEEDRKLWLDTMDSKDPIQNSSKNISSNQQLQQQQQQQPQRQEECFLDELGFAFVRKCIEIIETRGLDDQGLYRVGGVTSKVTRLIQSAFDRKKHSMIDSSSREFHFDFDNPDEWEIRTITSALKYYFRNLPEPLMTYRLHNAFIASAKQENRVKRVDDIHALIHRLPKLNFEMLYLLICHLKNVAQNSEKNLMPVNNLGVCLGPSLLRPEEETVAAIMDTKFANVVVEILIENCDKIFNTTPNENLNQRPSIQQTDSSSFQQQQQQQFPTYDQQHRHHYSESTSNNNLTTYATIPVRSSSSGTGMSLSMVGGVGVSGHSQVYRSGSHDQLAQQQIQYRNRQQQQLYQQQQQQQMMSASTSSSLMFQAPSQNSSIYPSNDSRQTFRPIAVYNPWSNQQQLPQQQQQQQAYVENHQSEKQKSPVNSIGSSIGENQHQQQQQSSPRTSPSFPNQPTGPNSTFYAYNSSGGSNSSGSNNNNNNNNNSNNNRQSQQNLCTNASNAPSTVVASSSTTSAAAPPPPTPSSLHSTSNSTISVVSGRKVRTLYACVGENDSELSFEPNVVIYNVRQSREPGWLEGCYNGKVGLIPRNYVQFID